jgi:alpha-ketoglutarate-dependent 2,4-dichlorophenoxyacetate dioxygenase
MSTTTQTQTSTSTILPILHLRPADSPIYTPLHPTFGAQVDTIDFSQPLSTSTITSLQNALGKYGVLVFRSTGLTDQAYVNLARHFGELVQVPPSRRFPTQGLSDPSNLYLDGSIVKPGDLRWYMAKETALFHSDATYDARRVRCTSIIARELPPKGTGGATEFGDTRTAYDNLDVATKQLLEGKIGVHSHFHSRKVALPDFPTFKALNPLDYPMSRHKIVQTHAGSGRKTLYIASHLHHIEGMPEEESSALILRLRKMVEEEQYVLKVFYENEGDVVIWDNTATMHRAGGGTWAGKYKRDMRKWMTFDGSEEEWGENSRDTKKFLAGPVIEKKHEEIYGKDGRVWDFDED